MQSCSWAMAGFFTGCVCFGQTFSVGALGGLRGTDDLSSGGATSVSKRYVAGPSLEVGLPLGLAIEADGLYRRMGFQTQASSGPYSTFATENANVWEVPILLKWRVPSRAVKPFVEAGYAPRIVAGSIVRHTTGVYPIAPGETFSGYYATWSNDNGFVAGGGMEFALGRLRLSPTLRYTRWSGNMIYGAYGGTHELFYNVPSWTSTQNQVDVLLGIAWKVR